MKATPVVVDIALPKVGGANQVAHGTTTWGRANTNRDSGNRAAAIETLKGIYGGSWRSLCLYAHVYVYERSLWRKLEEALKSKHTKACNVLRTSQLYGRV